MKDRKIDFINRTDLIDKIYHETVIAVLSAVIQKTSGFDPERHSYLAVEYADALLTALRVHDDLEEPKDF